MSVRRMSERERLGRQQIGPSPFRMDVAMNTGARPQHLSPALEAVLRLAAEAFVDWQFDHQNAPMPALAAEVRKCAGALNAADAWLAVYEGAPALSSAADIARDVVSDPHREDDGWYVSLSDCDDWVYLGRQQSETDAEHIAEDARGIIARLIERVLAWRPR